MAEQADPRDRLAGAGRPERCVHASARRSVGPVLGQSVVVENRVGAAGSIGARACADSEPDGYTICILNNESMVINPLIQNY